MAPGYKPGNQQQAHTRPIRYVATALAWAAAGLISACGGGDSAGSADASATQTTTQTSTDTIGSATPVSTPVDCSATAQKSWLRTMMQDLYFWYRQAPNPEPDGYDTAENYFKALLHTTLDRWSYFSTLADDNRFYQDGTQYGYGVRLGYDPQNRLRIGYVEPDSPLQALGLKRGMIITRVNGQAPLDISAAKGWTAILAPEKAGVVMNLELLDPDTGATRTAAPASSLVTLQPVTASVVTANDGAKVGYLLYNYQVAPAESPMIAAFADFAAAGVSDVVLDLRYNGGGYVYLANELAAMVAGSAVAGATFVDYAYNDKHPEKLAVEKFRSVPAASQLNLKRVFVLVSSSTCSASELVINGLKPFVEVIQIGGTTCGKPYGMVRQARCDVAYYPIQFQMRNAVGVGEYADGITPTCRVNDDLAKPLGDPSESLFAAALAYRNTGACGTTAATAALSRAAQRGDGFTPLDLPFERGMSRVE